MSKFIKNTFIYTFGKIIQQLAGFVLLPVYTAYMLPAEYGIVQSMQVLGTILVIFFSVAAERSMARLYFDYKTDSEQRTLIGNVTIIIFTLSSFFLILIFAGKSVVSKIYSSIDFYPYFMYAILNAYFLTFTQIQKVIFQIKEKAGTFLFISMLQFFSGIAFILYFVVIAKQGAEGMLKGQMIGNIAVMPLFIYYSFKQSVFKIRYDMIKSILFYSIPIVPSLIFAWVQNLSDRIFIEQYWNLNEVGIYSLGYKIAAIATLFTGAFNSAYTPIFYRVSNDEKEINPKEKLKNYNYTYILIIILISFSIAFLSKEIIGLFLNLKYFESWKIVHIICLSYLISSTAGLLNLMIYQQKKTFRMLMIISISATANIAFNFILIPVFGSIGAAWATVITSVIFFAIAYQYAKKYYFIPFLWNKIILITTPLIALATINFFISFNNLSLSLIIKFILLLILTSYIYFSNKKPLLAIIKTSK